MIAPTSLALVLDGFPAERRAAGVGLWGAAAAAAAAVGPTLGGALVELSDWRLVFLVNLPLGAAVRLGRRRSRLRERPPARQPPARPARRADAGAQPRPGHAGDRRGQRLGLDRGRDPRLLRRLRALLAGLSCAAARHPRPIVEPALFRHRSFRVGNLGTLLFAAAFFSLILGNVVFLTSIWGYTVLQAGAATLPGPALSTVVAGPAGQLADRFGHRAVIVPGTLFFAAGVMVLRSAGAKPDWLGLWLPGACLTGIGIGLAFPTLGSAAVRDIPDDRFATASAVNAAFRQVGAVLGTAILVAIVGDPAAPAGGARRSDSAYLFAVFAALVWGAAVLGLRRQSSRAGGGRRYGARRYGTGGSKRTARAAASCPANSISASASAATSSRSAFASFFQGRIASVADFLPSRFEPPGRAQGAVHQQVVDEAAGAEHRLPGEAGGDDPAAVGVAEQHVVVLAAGSGPARRVSAAGRGASGRSRDSTPVLAAEAQQLRGAAARPRPCVWSARTSSGCP